MHDDLLLQVHGRDMFTRPDMADERNYYKPKAGRHDAHVAPKVRNWSAGMAVYDISKPAQPKQIGFMPVEGTGIHRIWYVGRPLGLRLGDDRGLHATTSSSSSI